VPARAAVQREPAADNPVARLALDVPLAHLDRPFDYFVPADLASAAHPGARVRVRFSGRLVHGFVLSRHPASDHSGRLAYLDRVVSAEVVLTPEVARLARAVAEHWGGSLSAVLRLAVPPRHARTEAETGANPVGPPTIPSTESWSAYPAGTAYLTALRSGRAPRAVWTALPGEDWPARVAEAAQACVAGGRGVVLLVPDRRDLARVDAALLAALGSERYVTLSADLGPAQRYRNWLRVSRSQVRVVAGTRAAAYAPVADLGLVGIWDDGDDLYAEPRAPYAHARDVLVMRAHLSGAGALLGAAARSTEASQLVATGWARDLRARTATIRSRAPAVRAMADDEALARDPAARTARLPSVAWQAAGTALRAGQPVLVQVPRRGYVPALACVRCHAPARCATCGGPLGTSRSGPVTLPSCRWCGRPAADWACPVCGERRLRAVVVGARRTAEELGRAFPGAVVRTSGRDAVLDTVGPAAAIVVATPGAEPVAEGGYGAALLLDGWALLTRADLRASEEALRRWMNAATLVRPGGAVLVGADAGVPAVQALVRWAPAWLAERELSERVALGFPPASRFASITGVARAVAEVIAAARLPSSAQLLGPVPVDSERERMLVRVPRADGAALARSLHEAQGVRSARKAADPVRIQLDPLEGV